jgi:hypothetical protein
VHLLMMTASWRSDFQAALAGAFASAFTQVVFAIADCSPERRFLAPFAARLASQNPPLGPPSPSPSKPTDSGPVA